MSRLASYRRGMIDEQKIAERCFGPELNERQRRIWAAAEALSHVMAGSLRLRGVAGISRDTIERGIKELREGVRLQPGQVRRPGAGRPKLTDSDPTLLEDLQALVDPDTRGDPMSPLRWTTKSLMKLAGALAQTGHTVSDSTVGKLLKGLGFRLHANVKTREGSEHPDRDAQFREINETTRAALAAGQPVISVDTKKRELVGDFKAVGREYEPTGKPVEVRTHDFKDKQLGHAIPYGVYDIAADEGMVSVGVTKDTSQFAVASILAWWQHLGARRYPDAKTLTITADGGGSNSSRTRLWKTELQRLADEIGLAIRVCHFPPGTSKWNKIEHGCQLRGITGAARRWRAWSDLALIASTPTPLPKVYARLDPRYERAPKSATPTGWREHTPRLPPDWITRSTRTYRTKTFVRLAARRLSSWP